MKLKKLLSAVSAAVITVSCVGVLSAFADPRESADDELSDGLLKYERVDDGYKVIGYESGAIFDTIPSMRNGYAVVEIGDQAFAGNTTLGNIKIPATVKKIGAYAFASCESIKKVTISGNGLTEIGDGAFAGCDSITEMILPDSVKSIGMIAFQSCTALEDFKIPSKVETIGDAAFEYCFALTELHFPSTLKELGQQALLECPVQTITADENQAVTVVDNVLYNKSKTRLIRAGVGIEEKNFNVPESVLEIEDGAFFDCEEIESVYIPPSVGAIGQEAFMYCINLKDLHLSEGLMEIDNSAFAQCANLTSVAVPTTVSKIGSGAFYCCVNLSSVIIPNTNLKTIDSGAFSICDALHEVTVPECVDTIGNYAFGYTIENDSSSQLSRMSDFKMNVVSGSAAHKYAKSNKIEFNTTGVSVGRIVFIAVCVVLICGVIVLAFIFMKKGWKPLPRKQRVAEENEKAENDPGYEKIVGDEDNKSETETKN